MTLEEVQATVEAEAGSDHGIHVVLVPVFGDDPYEWQLKLDAHVVTVRRSPSVRRAEHQEYSWHVRSRRSHTPHVVYGEREALLAAIRWMVAEALGVASVHGVLLMTTAEIRQMAEARQAQRPARPAQVTGAHWDAAGVGVIDDPIRPTAVSDFETFMESLRGIGADALRHGLHLHRSAPAKAFSPALLDPFLDGRSGKDFEPRPIRSRLDDFDDHNDRMTRMLHATFTEGEFIGPGMPVMAGGRVVGRALPAPDIGEELLCGLPPTYPALTAEEARLVAQPPSLTETLRRATMECPAAHVAHATGGGAREVFAALLGSYRDAMQRLERHAMAAPPPVFVVDDALRQQVAGDLTLRRLRAALGLGEGAAVEDEVEAIVQLRALVNEMVDWCSRHVPEPPWDSEVEQYGPELAHAVNASRWLRTLRGLVDDERRHSAKVKGALEGKLERARADLTAAHVECAHLAGEVAALLQPVVDERVARKDAARQRQASRPRCAQPVLHVPGDAPPLAAPTFAPGDDPTRHLVDDEG